MSHGRRPRGPVGRIPGLARVEGTDVILRIRALERVSGPAPVMPRSTSERSFAEALERSARGLSRSEPLPAPARRRPPPPPQRVEEDDEAPLSAEPLPTTFLGLLWWKVTSRF